MIWSGVYLDAKKALTHVKKPSIEFTFESAVRNLNQVIESEGASNSYTAPPRETNLSLLVSTLKPETIIDWGGGSGWVFDYIARTNWNNSIRKYYVVEQPELIEKLTELGCASRHKNLIFTESIPIEEGAVFYSNSSIQYIEDHYLIEIVKKSKCKHIFIENFLGGEHEDFYTLQKFYDGQFLVKFRNLDKFVDTLLSAGYRLMSCIPYVSVIKGNYQFLPMENFDDSHKYTHSFSLYFQEVMG